MFLRTVKPSLTIVGLGNPGASYAHTRHNAGFMAVDALSKAFGTGPWKYSSKYQSDIQEARIVAAPVLLVKPRTFMNLSGQAAGSIVDFYKLQPADALLAICDDVDLPLGTLRMRTSGSAGTHNGLKSLVDRFGESFARLRIGIGPKPEGADLATWVLCTLLPEEQRALGEAFVKIPDIVREFVLGSNGTSGRKS